MLLCCGEALIDMIPTPTTNGDMGFVPHSGGAIFNTAVALGRLGVPAGMLTGMSSDLFGQQLTEALQASRVDTSLLIACDRPTTLAFVKLVNGHASYSFFDENSAGRMLAPADLPVLPNSVTALYFGGISLACEPGAETYATLAEREASNRVIMLDPNIRPSFITNPTAYRDRLDRMISRADIVKVSDEDLDWIFPGQASLEDKVEQLRVAGPSIVILTRGADGASGYFGNGARIDVPVRKVDVVDTVGAGDTFNAGVLAKLSELGLLSKSALAEISGQPLGEALEHGAKVAAITVSRAGANSPWRDEITS
ncbi:carbohydrate kinase [Rhodobacterales bacterium 56_14_T64]|nr:carbohydrate kinase [Rhodobacterales bacterium 56_14_T64]